MGKFCLLCLLSSNLQSAELGHPSAQPLSCDLTPSSGAAALLTLPASTLVDRSNVKERLIAAFKNRFGIEVAEPAWVENQVGGSFVAGWTSTAYVGNKLYRIFLRRDGSVLPAVLPFRRPAGDLRVAVLVVDHGNTNISALMDTLWPQVQAQINQLHADFAASHGYARPLVQFVNTNLLVSSGELANPRNREEVINLLKNKGHDPSRFDLFVALNLDAARPSGGFATLGGDFIFVGYFFRAAGFSDLTLPFLHGRSMLYFLAQAVYGHECGHIFGWEHEWTSDWRIDLLPFITDPMLFGWVDTNANGVPEILEPSPYRPGPEPVAIASFPLLSGSEERAEDLSNTGLALTNISSSSSQTVRLLAFDRTGKRIEDPGILNPAEIQIEPRQQISLLDSQIFGPGVRDLKSGAWIRMEGSGVGGAFMGFAPGLRSFDGSRLSTKATTSLILPEVLDAASTHVYLFNPGNSAATVTFELRTPGGQERVPAVLRNVEINGSLDLPVADLFAGAAREGDYLRLRSNREVVLFASLRKPGAEAAVLEGQEVWSGSTTLYSLHYAAGGAWRTQISVVNLDFSAGTLSVRLMRDDGTQIGATRSLELPARGKIQIDSLDFFGSPGGQLVLGYVEISSSGPRLSGSVSFTGTHSEQASFSALPLLSPDPGPALLGFVASNDFLFTGIALLNPNASPQQVQLELYDQQGRKLAVSLVNLPENGRTTGLLTDFFPEVSSRVVEGGYVKVSGDKPLAVFGLIGTWNLSVLTAVPSQPF